MDAKALELVKTTFLVSNCAGASNAAVTALSKSCPHWTRSRLVQEHPLCPR